MAVGVTQPSGTEASLRTEPADRSVDYSVPSGPEIKNAWSCYPMPPSVSKRDAVGRLSCQSSQFPSLGLCSDTDPFSGSLFMWPASLYFVPPRVLPL